MLLINRFSCLLLTSLLALSFGRAVNAKSTATLTVVVNGISNQKGMICMGVYSRSQGFPMNTKDVTTSACVKAKGGSLTHTFSGLLPGNYAVAIIDDQNGDRRLNTDFLGIPKEGFGISKNPTVSMVTGAPKFYDASFLLLSHQNTTINILMKYSLDS